MKKSRGVGKAQRALVSFEAKTTELQVKRAYHLAKGIHPLCQRAMACD